MDAAEACRALAARSRYGALATVTRAPDRPGWPFATLVALAFDEGLRALLCLSALAEHTKNLTACSYASVLVTEAGTPDPLASGRMTIVGRCARVAANEADDARRTFLGVHPEAAGYASFADFAMWRMDPEGAWWVGGFGRMEWVRPSDSG